MVRAFNFEIYTCNPLTGETGWEIYCISVYAESKAEAKELLKEYPHFDCIILFNYETELDETDVELYANGYTYRNTTND